MKHRHLQLTPETPPERWPSAALVDLLERGDLADWQPLAAAVAREPSGPLAARPFRLLEAYPSYGTSTLWRCWLDRCRAREDGPLPAARLRPAGLRRRRGLTQVELAGRLGMSQSDLSKLERRRDVRLSTLRAFVRALGGRLQLLVQMGAERVELEWPEKQ